MGGASANHDGNREGPQIATRRVARQKRGTQGQAKCRPTPHCTLNRTLRSHGALSVVPATLGGLGVGEEQSSSKMVVSGTDGHTPNPDVMLLRAPSLEVFGVPGEDPLLI